MLSGSLGNSFLGQFALGSIIIENSSPVIVLNPAPYDRTFYVPQNGAVWQAEKTPDLILNFSFNWSAEIGTDTIVDSTWLLESADLTQNATNIDSTDTIATVLLSGGIAENVYNVINLITTESGLQLEATFRLFVNEYNW